MRAGSPPDCVVKHEVVAAMATHNLVQFARVFLDRPIQPYQEEFLYQIQLAIAQGRRLELRSGRR